MEKYEGREPELWSKMEAKYGKFEYKAGLLWAKPGIKPESSFQTEATAPSKETIKKKIQTLSDIKGRRDVSRPALNSESDYVYNGAFEKPLRSAQWTQKQIHYVGTEVGIDLLRDEMLASGMPLRDIRVAIETFKQNQDQMNNDHGTGIITIRSRGLNGNLAFLGQGRTLGDGEASTLATCSEPSEEAPIAKETQLPPAPVPLLDPSLPVTTIRLMTHLGVTSKLKLNKVMTVRDLVAMAEAASTFQPQFDYYES